MKVGVLDYGSGNLHSVAKALSLAGAEVVVTNQAKTLAKLSRLVVPGVGSFDACMAGIKAVGGDEIIRDFISRQYPLLGICVGHQVMFSAGNEHGRRTAGLGIFPGVVEKLTAKKLPHMGWNKLLAPKAGVFSGLDNHWVYFVHSYGAQGRQAVPADAEIALAEYGGQRFIAAVSWKSVLTTQFHPEKSGASGAMIIRNWLMR